jgi:hypothetical protein
MVKGSFRSSTTCGSLRWGCPWDESTPFRRSFRTRLCHERRGGRGVRDHRPGAHAPPRLTRCHRRLRLGFPPATRAGVGGNASAVKPHRLASQSRRGGRGWPGRSRFERAARSSLRRAQQPRREAVAEWTVRGQVEHEAGRIFAGEGRARRGDRRHDAVGRRCSEDAARRPSRSANRASPRRPPIAAYVSGHATRRVACRSSTRIGWSGSSRRPTLPSRRSQSKRARCWRRSRSRPGSSREPGCDSRRG